MPNAGMSFDAIVNGLVALKVPRAKAEARARELTGRTLTPAAGDSPARPILTLPMSFRLPWSMLVSDNDRSGVLNGQLILRRSYREAKRAIAAHVLELIGHAEPVASPVMLVARVYVPDNRPHDVANFGKCVHDALQQVIYVNDRWLYDARWRREGVDVDAPHADVMISPYL